MRRRRRARPRAAGAAAAGARRPSRCSAGTVRSARPTPGGHRRTALCGPRTRSSSSRGSGPGAGRRRSAPRRGRAAHRGAGAGRSRSRRSDPSSSPCRASGAGRARPSGPAGRSARGRSRALHGMTHELIEALLLEAGKALARPARALRERPRQPGAGGEVSQPRALIGECHRGASRALGSREVVEEQAAHPLPETLVHELGHDKSLEREPELHGVERRPSACADRRAVRSRDRPRGARAHRRPAPARACGSPRTVRAAPAGARRAPRTRRRPRASRRPGRAAAPPRATGRRARAPSRGGGDLALDLGNAALGAALVDGEEEVLLRREVRVDRALGVAGLAGDLSTDVAWNPCSTKSRSAASTPARGSAAAARLGSGGLAYSHNSNVGDISMLNVSGSDGKPNHAPPGSSTCGTRATRPGAGELTRWRRCAPAATLDAWQPHHE